MKDGERDGGNESVREGGREVGREKEYLLHQCDRIKYVGLISATNACVKFCLRTKIYNICGIKITPCEEYMCILRTRTW